MTNEYEERFNKKINTIIQIINQNKYITLKDLEDNQEINLRRNSLYSKYFSELKKRGIIFSRVSFRGKGRPSIALSVKPLTSNGIFMVLES